MAIMCFGVFTFCLLKYFEPAEAAQYRVSGNLSISSIGLDSKVTDVDLDNGKLPTPENIIGSYSRHDNKTFLFGHSSNIFKDLQRVRVDDEINYDNKTYRVSKIEVREKSDIKMSKLLAAEEVDTIVLMTCAGDIYDNGDASHRLIIYATV